MTAIEFTNAFYIKLGRDERRMENRKKGRRLSVRRNTRTVLQSKALLFYTPRRRDIMDTFPIVKRKDEKEYGEYRTKRVILEIYDAMQDSIRTGQPYQTRLDPPPADPSLCHPPK